MNTQTQTPVKTVKSSLTPLQRRFQHCVEVHSGQFKDSGWTDELVEIEENDNNLLVSGAKLLKKGDKVRFIWYEKIKDKNVTFGFRLKPTLLEGVVDVPFKHKMQSMFRGQKAIAGDDYTKEWDEIKIHSGQYIYPVSPEDVELLVSKPVEISKSSVSELGEIRKQYVFTDLSNQDRDALVSSILKEDSTLKPAAIRQQLAIKTGYIATYDDVFYSVQRVKLNIKWEQYKKTTNQK